MKCYACGSEKVESNMSQCPDCGFANMTVVGDQAQFDAMMKSMAAEYRQKKIGGAQLGLITYQYAMKNDRLVLDHESEMNLGVDVTGMSVGQIWWDSTDFARVDAGEELNLNLFVKKDGQVRKVAEKQNAPDGSGFWHIGIKLLPGFAFSVLVGNEQKYSESRALSLC